MAQNLKLPVTLFAALLMSGCASLPRFSGPPGLARAEPAGAGVPKVSDIITHVQCEILSAVTTEPVASALNGHHLVVNANLTMEVKDDGGVNPSLSFIHPFATDGTSRTLGFGAGLQGTAHRTYNQEFTLDLSNRTSAGQSCSGPETRASGIQGSLGIGQIIAEGLRHMSADSYLFKPVAMSGDNAPTFGSQIDFTAVYGLSADPLWTLTHFEGPAGGSSSLLGYTRTHTETLILSFSAAAPASATLESMGAPDVEAAARRARDNTLRMILQRLVPNR